MLWENIKCQLQISNWWKNVLIATRTRTQICHSISLQMRVNLFKRVTESQSAFKIEFCPHSSLALMSMRSSLAGCANLYWYVILPWKDQKSTFHLNDWTWIPACFYVTFPLYCLPSVHIWGQIQGHQGNELKNRWPGNQTVCLMQPLPQRSKFPVLIARNGKYGQVIDVICKA